MKVKLSELLNRPCGHFASRLVPSSYFHERQHLLHLMGYTSPWNVRMAQTLLWEGTDCLERGLLKLKSSKDYHVEVLAGFLEIWTA